MTDAAVEKSLVKANERLKGGGVAIEVRGETEALYLRGTFPARAGSGKSAPYRQRIALKNDQGKSVKASSVASIQWAEQQAKRLSSDLNLGQFSWADWLDESHESLNPSLVALWDKYTAYKRGHLSETTIAKDFSRVRNHLIALGHLAPDNAIAIKEELVTRLTAHTARRVLMQLNACHKWALEHSLIERNPFEGMAGKVKVVKGDEIDPFAPDETAKIIEGFTTHPNFRHYLPFVQFLFMTGCRTSEAVGLRWGNITDDLSVVTFAEAVVEGARKGTKTSKVRRFPCSEKLRGVLTSVRPESPDPLAPVFVAPKGGLIDAHNFLNRAWKTVLRLGGVRYRYQYQTRHTFVSTCIEKGIPVPQIARWVGNSPDVILRHYSGEIERRQVPDII